MQITAAVLRAPGAPLNLEAIDLDEPRDDEVVVRIVSSGICHTDLSAMAGGVRSRYPIVLGHEGAGIVERVGAGVRSLVPGDHVVLSFDYCGVCDRCRAGAPCYCREFTLRNFSGSRPDGSSALSRGGERVFGHYFGQSSFATYALARETNAIKVRRDVPLEALGPLGCGVQTGAGAVLNTFRARPGSALAVFGTGSVGLSAVIAGVLAGCTVIVGVDILPERLEVARALGATHVFDGRDPDLVEKIIATTGRGVDFAFDTTGVALEAAARSLDELGVLGLVGGVRGGRLDLPFETLRRGRSIRTIIEGDSVPSQFIPTLVDLWAQGRFPFDRLVTYYSFDQINEAARDSEHGRAIKPVLRFA
ncbi:MAG: NAD(P)-dependent alcohol dehydrogenase [Chloroflexota bacterium]|nr:NAD(P)-dependent alcohol dehydrogenase [Dehalococcoidia bacterium]MDW8253718.1 NAD(P)-dependent alcohol dehydrogenase [Chloroflexota bacterium]